MEKKKLVDFLDFIFHSCTMSEMCVRNQLKKKIKLTMIQPHKPDF